MRLLLLCGSLRAGSVNHAVLDTAKALLPGADSAAAFGEIARLPHFSPDDDHDPLPDAVARLRTGIAGASALLISTPEYAGALPGSFKNVLDWTIGGGEIYGKPVAWINASGPAAPTAGADAHESLRKVLTYAGADIVEAACARIPVARSDVGPDGVIGDESIRREIAAVLDALRDHVDRVRDRRSI